ncbi:CHRD domain-containing protein [Moorena sp. SIO4G3]|uniref:CHRD domain-containing protein n=1 Tax=Moorena sp. SIO4G3 TaxID=2607821 RepID=UPI00142941E7|nr:CHRD domain-containing protein [Moorena sp. SIO4G3]NEO79229.1 CHRD domain-containing protein [Moorena sp. SIO4G3]
MKHLLTPLVIATILGIVSPVKAATLFRADLDASQVVPPTSSAASGIATFKLNEEQTKLDYLIELNGLTLKPDQEARTEAKDVTKIHLHFGAPNTNGPHVLNIFGLPREDDNDLVVDYVAGTLKGTWDNSDAIDPNTGQLFDPQANGTYN